MINNTLFAAMSRMQDCGSGSPFNSSWVCIQEEKLKKKKTKTCMEIDFKNCNFIKILKQIQLKMRAKKPKCGADGGKT